MGTSGKGSPVRRARRRKRAGFDFTHHVRLVVADMVARLEELHHIDLARVAVGFCQARKRVPYGLYASLTPMRFENGARHVLRRGKRFAVQQLFGADGQEMLYILRFYLPRFLDTSFQEKLVTILHELWHISPDFNGDLRRHSGRCYVHTHSQEEYDRHMAQLAEKWLSLSPPAELYEFLHFSFQSLYDLHNGMYGVKIPQPKLIPVDAAK